MDHRTAFVSGHLDVSEIEFLEHYVPALENAFFSGDVFVVGDAPGTDTMAQTFLSKLGAKVTVYHMFESPRINVGGSVTSGGYSTDLERDAAMTEASDYDIAWVRKGREKSFTAANILRRSR